MIESKFEGSPLQTELRNANKDKFLKLKYLTLNALSNNSQSIFWHDAVNYLKTLSK